MHQCQNSFHNGSRLPANSPYWNKRLDTFMIISEVVHAVNYRKTPRLRRIFKDQDDLGFVFCYSSSKGGYYVHEVSAGKPAERAGLKVSCRSQGTRSKFLSFSSVKFGQGKQNFLFVLPVILKGQHYKNNLEPKSGLNEKKIKALKT